MTPWSMVKAVARSLRHKTTQKTTSDYATVHCRQSLRMACISCAGCSSRCSQPRTAPSEVPPLRRDYYWHRRHKFPSPRLSATSRSSSPRAFPCRSCRASQKVDPHRNDDENTTTKSPSSCSCTGASTRLGAGRRGGSLTLPRGVIPSLL